MQVAIAQEGDINAWLTLAFEVEMFFGPLVDGAAFEASVRKNIERGTALCIREGNGLPGTPLAGGLLFAPVGVPFSCKYELSWVAVAERWRRRGVARALVNELFAQVGRPAHIVLLTSEQGDCAARAFFQRVGFVPGESGPINADGVVTQVFRLDLPYEGEVGRNRWAWCPAGCD